MAWPNKDFDFQGEFGMSKDEVKAALAKAKTHEETITGLNNTIQTQTTELQTVKDSLASIEQRVSNSNNNNNNNNTNNNNGNVTIPSVNDDEDAAFAARMTPLYQQNMLTNFRVVKSEVFSKFRQKDGKLFDKMQKEVEDLLEKTPLGMKGGEHAEKVIENAYLVIKGRHADDIIAHNAAKSGEFYVEPSGASGGNNNQTSNDKKNSDELTADELALCARMKLTPEQFKAQRGQVNLSGALRYV